MFAYIRLVDLCPINQDYFKLDGDPWLRTLVKTIGAISGFARPNFHRKLTNTRTQLNNGRLSQVYFSLAVIVFLGCVIITFRSIYRHFVYECHLIQLDLLNGTRNLEGESLKAKRRQVLELVHKSRDELRAEGSPFFYAVDEYRFLVICFLFHWTSLAITSYFMPMLYLRYVSPLDRSHFLRAITDPRRELALANEIVMDQVNLVIDSVQQYIEICIATCMECKWANSHGTNRDERPGQPAYWLDQVRSELGSHGKPPLEAATGEDHADIRQLLRWAENYLLALKKMAILGLLNPICNEPAWLDFLSLAYVLAWLSTFGIILTSIPTIKYLIPFSMSLEPADNVVLVALVLQSIIWWIGGIYYLFTLACSLVDQIRSIRWLHTRARECIQTNERLLEHDNHEESDLRTNQEANRHLLLFVMQYKISTCYLDDFYAILAFTTWSAYLIIFTTPIGFLVHTSYLRTTSSRALLVYESLAVVFFIDLLVFPACYIRSEISKLNRTFGSLSSHVIARQREYYDFSQILLRKENLNLDRLMDKCPGYSFDYVSSLRAHFWLGILLMAAWWDGGQLLGAYLRDPLGLLKLAHWQD